MGERAVHPKDVLEDCEEAEVANGRVELVVDFAHDGVRVPLAEFDSPSDQSVVPARILSRRVIEATA